MSCHFCISVPGVDSMFFVWAGSGLGTHPPSSQKIPDGGSPGEKGKETFPQQKGDVRPGKRFPFAASNFELSDMNRNVSCVPGLSVEGVSHRI